MMSRSEDGANACPFLARPASVSAAMVCAVVLEAEALAGEDVAAHIRTGRHDAILRRIGAVIPDDGRIILHHHTDQVSTAVLLRAGELGLPLEDHARLVRAVRAARRNPEPVFRLVAEESPALARRCQRFAWWSYRDLEFLSPEAFQQWLSWLDAETIGNILTVCTRDLGDRIADALPDVRCPDVSARRRGVPDMDEDERPEQAFAAALNRLIAAVERGDLAPPLDSFPSEGWTPVPEPRPAADPSPRCGCDGGCRLEVAWAALFDAEADRPRALVEAMALLLVSFEAPTPDRVVCAITPAMRADAIVALLAVGHPPWCVALSEGFRTAMMRRLAAADAHARGDDRSGDEITDPHTMGEILAGIRQIIDETRDLSPDEALRPRVIDCAGSLAHILTDALGVEAWERLVRDVAARYEPAATMLSRFGSGRLEDLLQLSPADRHTLFATRFRAETVADALADAGPDLRAAVVAALSKPLAEQVIKKLDGQGPVRDSEIRRARRCVLDTARRMIARGEMAGWLDR